MKNKGLTQMRSCLIGLGSNSNGLRPWENDATRLRIMFLISIWPPGAQKIKKIPSLLSADAGIYVIIRPSHEGSPHGLAQVRILGLSSLHICSLRPCGSGNARLRTHQAHRGFMKSRDSGGPGIEAPGDSWCPDPPHM